MTTPAQTKSFSLGVLILAAGASTRMGRPKLLLSWGKTSLLGHLLNQWTSLGASQIAVVSALSDAAIAGELDRLRFPSQNRIANPAPERGMFSSIQCAAQWQGWQTDLTHVAIVLGDQPHLREATLRSLIEFTAAHPHRICEPSRRGRERHPVVLPAAVFTELKEAADPHLKAFLERHSALRAFCESDDPGLDFDIDRPGDYESAHQLYFGRPPTRQEK